MNLTDLASFVRVAELGTITAAAEAEGVPKSTISRRIGRLEDELDLELLRRSARSFTLTEDGKLLHARSIDALRELESVEQALTDAGAEPRGRLVITTPADFGRTEAMAELLAEYRRRYPQVSIDARLESRVVDLVAEGVDIGIRLHGGQVPGEAGLMARSLGALSASFYASCGYLERNGTPQTAAELADHEVAAHTAMTSRALRIDGESAPLHLQSWAFRSGDFGLILGLVEAGAAIALLPTIYTLRPGADGALVRILPHLSVRSGGISIVWPASRHLAPRVRAFIDLAAERLTAERLSGDGPAQS